MLDKKLSIFNKPFTKKSTNPIIDVTEPIDEEQENPMKKYQKSKRRYAAGIDYMNSESDNSNSLEIDKAIIYNNDINTKYLPDLEENQCQSPTMMDKNHLMNLDRYIPAESQSARNSRSGTAGRINRQNFASSSFRSNGLSFHFGNSSKSKTNLEKNANSSSSSSGRSLGFRASSFRVLPSSRRGSQSRRNSKDTNNNTKKCLNNESYDKATDQYEDSVALSPPGRDFQNSITRIEIIDEAQIDNFSDDSFAQEITLSAVRSRRESTRHSVDSLDSPILFKDHTIEKSSRPQRLNVTEQPQISMGGRIAKKLTKSVSMRKTDKTPRIRLSQTRPKIIRQNASSSEYNQDNDDEHENEDRFDQYQPANDSTEMSVNWRPAVHETRGHRLGLDPPHVRTLTPRPGGKSISRHNSTVGFSSIFGRNNDGSFVKKKGNIHKFNSAYDLSPRRERKGIGDLDFII